MSVWWNVNLVSFIKCPFDEKLMKCQFDVKTIFKHQFDETLSRWNVKLAKCHVKKMATWQNLKLIKWLSYNIRSEEKKQG